MNVEIRHDMTFDIELYVEEYYNHFISGFSYYCGPMFIQDSGQKFMVLSREDYIIRESDRLTSDKLQIVHMMNADLSDRSSITRLYNFLITEAVDEIRAIVRNYDTVEVFRVLHAVSAYMSEFHNRIDMVLSGQSTIPELSINETEKNILESVLNHPAEFRHNVEVVKGIDKVVMQYLAPLLLTTPMLESHHFSLTPNIFSKLFTLSGVAVKLIGDREIITSNFTSESVVKIRNGIIQPVENAFKRLSQFIDRYTSRNRKHNSEVSDDVRTVLVRNFEICFGFSPKTLESFLQEVNSRGLDQSVTVIVVLEQLIEMIVDFTGVTVEEATNLLQYFSLAPPLDSQFIYHSPEQYDKRLWEHPLALYGDESVVYVLFSLPLLLDALRILMYKITYNLIPECAGRSSEIIEKRIKNQLVKDVKAVLDTYETSLTMTNLQDYEVEIGGKTTRVHLQREIDVLCVLNETLFVIECKDISGRFSAAGFRADINKVKKFTVNMEKKVDEVKSKLTSIRKLFRRDIQTIVPMIVFRNPNIAMVSSYDPDDVTLIPIQELDSTITSYLQQ